MPARRFDVVIVGGGPRAVSIVERLIARTDADARLDVAIVDAIEVGAGATWRTDQSPELLNNTYAAHTTVFPDDASPIPAPAIAGPDLMGWVDTVVGEARNGWIGEEARRLKPWDFPSRRLQGAYYREQLARLEAIGVVDVTGFDCTAVRFASDVGADRAQVVELSDGTMLEGRTVVLAQGMIQARPTGDIQTFIEAARRPGLTYIAPGMPAEQDWHRVPGGEPVIARGLGATFFDVFPLLTKERGGRFERVGDSLSYQPSGREPIIFAGSRRGLPYRSKAYYPDGFPPAYVPRFATREWFEDVARTPNQDFAESIWPQIARELAWAHARTAVEAGHVRLNVPLTAVEATLAGTALDGIDAYLASVIDDPEWRFVLGELDRPPAGRVFEASEWQTWVDVYVARERASIIDPLTHPRNAVNRAMNAVRKTAAALTYRGAIDGYSTVRDVRGWFNSLGLYLSSGPPPHRTQELHALIKAGIVRLVGPQTQFAVDDSGFIAWSPGVRQPPIRAKTLIETRMSKGKVSRTSDPLLSGLLAAGKARIFEFPNADGTAAASESIDATVDFQIVLADGSAAPRVFVLGIPADASQPNSALGASPGVASPLIIRADGLVVRLIDGLRRCRPHHHAGEHQTSSTNHQEEKSNV